MGGHRMQSVILKDKVGFPQNPIMSDWSESMTEVLPEAELEYKTRL